jgi:hypothetical protein
MYKNLIHKLFVLCALCLYIEAHNKMVANSLGTIEYNHPSGKSIIAHLLNDYPKVEYNGTIYNNKEHLIYLIFGTIYTKK